MPNLAKALEHHRKLQWRRRPMKTKAETAEDALRGYPGETDHQITTMLIDMLHLAAREGLDLDRNIAKAKARYSDERAAVAPRGR